MNTMSKLGLGLCLAVAVTACGGASKEDATAGYAIARGFAATAAQKAGMQSAGSLRQRQEGTFSFTQDCLDSGNISMSGAFSGTTADFSFKFNACKQGGVLMDGGWDIGGTADSLTMVGTLSISSDQFDFSCDFDLAVSNNGNTITGTACGYDVSELGG